jgi:PAS domain S-box-containing protein
MPHQSDPADWKGKRKKIIGLGESSFRKSYYPQLRQKIEELSRFRTFLDNSYDAIFLITIPSGRILDVTSAVSRLLSYSPCEVVDRYFMDFFINNKIQALQNLFIELSGSADEKRTHITTMVSREGVHIPVELSLTSMVYNEIPSVVVVAHDITERVRAEEELKRSEERFRFLFEYAPDAFFIFDSSGRLIDGNHIATLMTGYVKEELQHKSLLDHDFVPPDNSSPVRSILEKNAQGFPTGPDELVLIRSDSERIIIELQTFPFRFEDRNSILGIARDITRRRQDEEEKNRAVRQITKNMEHFAILNDEIRNPLQIILALASLKEEEVNEKIVRQLQHIDGIINRLDKGYLESQKIRDFLKKHHGISDNER